MQLETGWHAIEHEVYHEELEGVGSSTLKHFLRSAAHGQYHIESYEDEQQLRLGAVVHMAILEPENFIKLPVEPAGDGRTKIVKEARADFRARIGKQKYASFEDVGKADDIREKLFAHPTWKAICEVNGVNENTGVYNDGSGRTLKIKPDRRAYSDFILDIKTTNDARQQNFDAQVLRNGWDLQAAFYFDTANKISPGLYKKFIWVAIETDPPYGVMFYEVGDLWLEIGRRKYKDALARYVNSVLSGNFHGYTEQIVVSMPPAYAQFY